MRYQQQCGEAARRETGLPAQYETYVAGCGGKSPGPEGVRA
jgi:hypothetical protein